VGKVGFEMVQSFGASRRQNNFLDSGEALTRSIVQYEHEVLKLRKLAKESNKRYEVVVGSPNPLL
jgi:hypothetical protein